MFRECITSTALTGPTPDTAFEHISGENFRGDISFLASARAFLDPRMEKDKDKVSIRFMNMSSDAPVSNEFLASAIGHDKLVIVNLSGSRDTSTKAMANVDAEFVKTFGGFVEAPKIRAFYDRSFAARCFVDRDKRASVVFADHIDMRTLHFLECSILIMLPWYFENDPKLSTDERALVDCLMNKEATASDYNRCIDKIAEKYDFRTSAIKTMLSGFETKYKRIQLDKARAELHNYDDNINSYLDMIRDATRQREDAQIRILGLEESIRSQSGDSELIEFMLAHKNIELVDVHDRSFDIIIKSRFSPMDGSKAEIDNQLKNKDSYIYQYNGRSYDEVSDINPNDMAMLIRAIFVDESVGLNLCGAYSIDLMSSHNSIARRDYPFSTAYSDYMPNPHINRYQCLGQNATMIGDCIARGNYLGAVMLCMTATGTIVPGDYTVMTEFMEHMYGIKHWNTHAIVLPDGRVCNPKEAIAWLKEQKGE